MGDIEDDFLDRPAIGEPMSSPQVRSYHQPGHGPWAHDEPELEPTGHRPPGGPREVPDGWRRFARPEDSFRLTLSALFAVTGLIGTLVGLGVFVGGDRSGLLYMGLVFVAAGGYGLKRTYGRVMTRRRVAKEGFVAVATVTELDWQRSLSVNGRNPYRMRWRFSVDERTYTGEATTMRQTVAVHDVGDRIWVIHDPDDPTQNLEWPLL